MRTYDGLVRKTWSGRLVEDARDYLAQRLPAPCARCGVAVTDKVGMRVGHIRDRVTHPDLVAEPSNWQVECVRCSDAGGQRAVQAKARQDLLIELGLDPADADKRSIFPSVGTASEPPPLPIYTHQSENRPIAVREGLTWDALLRDAPTWLQPYLAVPEDASPPLWVSGVHPEATGSHGPEAIAWMHQNLTERGRPLRLRWWQRLAIVLQLQHRRDGSLCFTTILESGPRRIGKSVRLRAVALWRLRHGPDLFEPEQLVLHTGKDLAIVREVTRKAWSWADSQEDWTSKRGMTEPEVAYQVVNRWIPRSKDATTGYDTCLALVDEAWDVPPASIDDDLEPSMLERESPQMLLTSTAHRRATSLMRGRISAALAEDDGETLVLIWAAPPGADEGDPAVWRAASPHWSESRRKMLAKKYAAASAGEVDPEADDLDPMSGFRSQYLNVWPLKTRQRELGNQLVSAPTWDALRAPLPASAPDSAAVEGWPGQGLSVARAWRQDGVVIVTAQNVPDLASAAQLVTGLRTPVLVGSSLATDPAWTGMRVKPMTGATLTAAADLARLVSERAIRHDDSRHLRTQVLEVRTSPGANGLRLRSTGRADAIKAAVWAAQSVRTTKSVGKPRILFAAREILSS